MRPEIIRQTDALQLPPVEVVGGKGLGLLKLAQLSRGRDFEVPEFYIIPVNFPYTESNLEYLYKQLPGPLAIRSSSPYEDSDGYSFAGQFESVLDVNDFDDFKTAIYHVLESASTTSVRFYAAQRGIAIDEKMAVIVQKMIHPHYSGVCYSTTNPENPKTIVEAISGLSHGLMSGAEQGSIASFDRDFNMTMEHGYRFLDLEKVARVASDLEDLYGKRMDVEYAVSDDTVHIVQARPVTDPIWEHVDIPTIPDARMIATADIARGSGTFTGPAFIFRSPKEMERYSSMRNKNWHAEREKQLEELREFDRINTDGYCLVMDTLEFHEQILHLNLENLKVLVTVDYASRFSHPIKIVSEMGIFYLGILGRKDLLDVIETGDTISVASDQTKGVIYDLVKTPVRLPSINVEALPWIQYEDAIGMDFPKYEEVDDKLFIDKEGEFGIFFWDYNEEQGVPSDVYYTLADVKKGLKLGEGEYHMHEAIYSYKNFPYLLHDLLLEAKLKSAKLSKKE